MTEKLFVLDLDHTLIYGSYAPSETAQFLFQYNKYLKVYERPYARALVNLVQSQGAVIVFTSAKQDYAQRIIEELDIKPIQLFSRADCLEDKGEYRKELPRSYSKEFSSITIIDDNPLVWLENKKFEILSPSKFFGQRTDNKLLEIIKQINPNDLNISKY